MPSKTPGKQTAKTPFKTPGNDENNPSVFGPPKTNLKKDGKQNSEAYITPLGKLGTLIDLLQGSLNTTTGPRTRAPLGMKTTNAKVHPAFKTPAPAQKTAKPANTIKRPSTARRSAKAKIHVTQPEPIEGDVLSAGNEDNVPDIEYCPPIPVSLPDPPEDITFDDSFPYLQGPNLCRGYHEVYDIPRDKEGIPLHEREADRAYERMVSKIEDRARAELCKSTWPNEGREDDIVDAMIAAGPKRADAITVDTVRARGAVNTLSSQASKHQPGGALRDTASSMRKKQAVRKPASQSTSSNLMRHNAAVATSRTTIGYTKGRNVSSSLPNRTAKTSRTEAERPKQSQIHPLDFRKLYGEPPIGSEMWGRLRHFDLLDEESADVDDQASRIWGMDLADEEEEEIFQLPVPDEIEI